MVSGVLIPVADTNRDENLTTEVAKELPRLGGVARRYSFLATLSSLLSLFWSLRPVYSISTPLEISGCDRITLFVYFILYPL
jgi:hypothetical protein